MFFAHHFQVFKNVLKLIPERVVVHPEFAVQPLVYLLACRARDIIQPLISRRLNILASSCLLLYPLLHALFRELSAEYGALETVLASVETHLVEHGAFAASVFARPQRNLALVEPHQFSVEFAKTTRN